MKLSQKCRYWLVIGISTLLSIGGIVASVIFKIDGGLGGALAVAFSFYVLFLRMNFGHRTFATLEERAKTRGEETLESLTGKLNALIARINVEEDGQSVQNQALALASCIGTLAWGFGNIIASWWK